MSDSEPVFRNEKNPNWLVGVRKIYRTDGTFWTAPDIEGHIDMDDWEAGVKHSGGAFHLGTLPRSSEKQ